MKSEHMIQDEIRLALSKYGIVLRQQSGNFVLKDGRRLVCGVKGLSDLLFIGQGFIAFLEVKNETNHPSQPQLDFIAMIKKMGHKAGVVRSSEDAIKLILSK